MSGSQCRARAASEALLGTFTCGAAILMLMLVEMAAGLMPASSGSFSRLNLQKLEADRSNRQGISLKEMM